MSERPKPGAPDAVANGCTCPVIDNHHGAGRAGDGPTFGWWISEGCPLHAPKTEAPA